jgi:energy-coupling factor transporter ATP-binding protein EcfA2
MIIEMSLEDYTKKLAGKLSGGNKRKLSVAISLLCTPKIVLLDEPSTGMDPEARRFMWSIIHKTSKKGKKSSVIMTTHSMDEAETLCKRMGIMVNGEFVCLGKASQIKDKYGYGYEIDIRIKPMNEMQQNQYLNKLNNFEQTFPYDTFINNNGENVNPSIQYNKKTKVDKGNIGEILAKLNKNNFINELKEDRLGKKIIKDIELNGSIPLTTLINWIFFVENAFKFIEVCKDYFEEIYLSEHIENNFLFKMKKGSNTKSIGFFFGLFEENKEECHVSEYSIQLTSLEQIFNKFTIGQNKIIDVNEEDSFYEENKNIVIDDIFLNNL